MLAEVAVGVLVLLHAATAAGADRPTPNTTMVATPEAALPSPYLRSPIMTGVGTVCAVQGRPVTSMRLAHDTTLPWWSDVVAKACTVGCKTTRNTNFALWAHSGNYAGQPGTDPARCHRVSCRRSLLAQ